MIRTRLRILMALLVLPYLAILGRLQSLQLVEETHAEYLRLSQHQMPIILSPRRGRIVSGDGRVLVGNRPIYHLHVCPRLVSTREEPLRIIVEEIGKRTPFADRAAVEARLLELASTVNSRGAGVTEGAEGGWILLVDDLDAETGVVLDRRLEEYYKTPSEPRAFRVVKDEFGDGFQISFDVAMALRREHVLRRLAKLIAPPAQEAAAYEGLVRRMDKVREWIEQALREWVEKRTAEVDAGLLRPDQFEQGLRKYRRDLLERRYLLERDVPSRAVTAIEYEPEYFDGIEVVDGVRREYPLGEATGTLTGHLRPIAGPPAKDEDKDEDKDKHVDEEKKLRDDGLLLDALSDQKILKTFANIRDRARRQSDLVAASGLEAYHDARLRGLYGMRRVTVDNRGRPRDMIETIPAVDGEDIHLTIDASLQEALYAALADAIGPVSAVAGSAVVIEVDGGAILASVGFPAIDLNRVDQKYRTDFMARWQSAGTLFLDRPTRQRLFPGSVFKLILATAALEEGVAWEGEYSKDRRYECNGTFPLLTSQHCAALNQRHPTADKAVDLVEALQYSCNVYFYYLGLEHLGPERIVNWAEAFGCRRSTGVDLPRSSYEEGTLKAADTLTTEAQVCHLSIGQVYVEMTPLQVARAVAAIASPRGELPIPRLTGPPRPPEPLPLRGKHTLETVREGMWRAGHAPGGTAAKPGLGLSKFSAGYKTGTAQVELTVGGEVRHHGWLVGFAPYAAPRIAFAVVLEKTNTEVHGAEACAPVVERLLEHFAAKDPDAYRVRSKGTGEGEP